MGLWMQKSTVSFWHIMRYHLERNSFIFLARHPKHTINTTVPKDYLNWHESSFSKFRLWWRTTVIIPNIDFQAFLNCTNSVMHDLIDCCKYFAFYWQHLFLNGKMGDKVITLMTTSTHLLNIFVIPMLIPMRVSTNRRNVFWLKSSKFVCMC